MIHRLQNLSLCEQQRLFLISVILKGVGSSLEMGIQILITRTIGLEIYGTYTTSIAASDLILGCFFSGLVKCNTFYLSSEGTSITHFKKKYYLHYVFPMIFFLLIIFPFLENRFSLTEELTFLRNPFFSFLLFITLTELTVMDTSSTFLARHHPIISLFGEYLLGRLVMLLGIAILTQTQSLDLSLLLLLHFIQYVIIFIFFLLMRQRKNSEKFQPDHQVSVSPRKWSHFQRADFVQMTITHLPILLQYFFTDAVEVSLVSIILLVKKLIGFISGPVSKIFLPEFSRLYKEERWDELATSYRTILKIQLFFLIPLGILLLTFSKSVLSFFHPELQSFVAIFQVCSAVFLLSSATGPSFGLLQMTEQEKIDTRFREIGLLLSFLFFVLFHHNHFFVLYSLLVQTLFENLGRYVYVSLWFSRKRRKEADL